MTRNKDIWLRFNICNSNKHSKYKSFISYKLQVAILLKMLNRLHTPPKLVELLLKDVRALLLLCPFVIFYVILFLLSFNDEILNDYFLQRGSLGCLFLFVCPFHSILSHSHEGSALEIFSKELVIWPIELVFISQRSNALVFLSIAMRNSPLLLADVRKILMFFDGWLRIGWHEVATITSNRGIIHINFPRC